MKIFKIAFLALCISFLKTSNTTKNKKNLKKLFSGDIDLPVKQKPSRMLANIGEAIKPAFLQLDKSKGEYTDNNGNIYYTSPNYKKLKPESLLPQIKLNLVINIENGDDDSDGEGESKQTKKSKGKGISTKGIPSGKIRVLIDGEDIKAMSKKGKGTISIGGQSDTSKTTTNKPPETNPLEEHSQLFDEDERYLREKLHEDEENEVLTLNDNPNELLQNNYNFETQPSPSVPLNYQETQTPKDWETYFQELNSRFINLRG